VLAGLGEKRPGQHELRPEHEVRSPPSRTWVERNDERLRRLSKWTLLVCFVAFWISMVGLAFGILSLSEGSARTVEADLLGPVGIPLLAAAGFWVGMILSLCLYGLQSFSRYRRLRRRLPEPRPPSPFKHSSRLVTILGTEGDELLEYGRRVRTTGWAFVIAAGMTAIIVRLLYRAV
jgi:hypothetical protein